MFSTNLDKISPATRSFENCLARRDRLFSIRRLVTLGKSNAFGGAYFAGFFAWTGEAREELLAKGGFPEGVTLHTSEARMKYFRELLPFQWFEIIVWPRTNRMSMSLRFFFVISETLIAVGDQTICLRATGNLIAVPPAVHEFVAQFDPT